jgi:transcriptional regulator with XRE-family HTH domain
MDIGDKIKSRRNELGFTLKEVADKLGVRDATVQRYESGNIKNLKQETISKLAEILNVKPEWLMGWTDSIPDFSKTKFIVEKWLCNADFLEIDDLTGSQEVRGSNPPSIQFKTPDLSFSNFSFRSLSSTLFGGFGLTVKIIRRRYAPSEWLCRVLMDWLPNAKSRQHIFP